MKNLGKNRVKIAFLFIGSGSAAILISSVIVFVMLSDIILSEINLFILLIGVGAMSVVGLIFSFYLKKLYDKSSEYVNN